MVAFLKESVLDNHVNYYPTPMSLNYFWSGGSLSGLCLGIQLITGIFLAMYYTPHVDYAFLSVEHIMRDVKNGWFIRYMHANGASFFFIFVYLHIARNLFYGSYVKPRQELWMSGIGIFILMMATAFLGYVLPWGQMSFWGATVITNFFSVIPFIGNDLMEWLWGGFSVNNATLNKFFSLHFVLPFVITGMVFLHLVLLHNAGSNNPLGISADIKLLNFYPYFYVKDLFSFLIVFFFLIYTISYAPNVFGHPVNYIVADPMVTPAHIVPEWYFLPFYAMLRSVPDKLGGILTMAGSLLIFFFLPLLDIYTIRSILFRPYMVFIYWFFIVDCLLLGWLGQKPVEDPYILLGQIMTVFYFMFFILVPVISLIESSDQK
jgi:ubiquinol-cytochrome c reductase cytochrome b subunit